MHNQDLNRRARKLWAAVRANKKTDPPTAQEKFTELVTLFNPFLFARFKTLTKNVEDANDLTSETWIKIWKSNTPQIKHFKSYLFRAVHNNHLSFIKKKIKNGYHVSLDEEYVQEPAIDATAHLKMNSEDGAQIVKIFIEANFNKTMKLIWPYHRDGYSAKEISKILDIPLTTVHTNIQRIKRYYDSTP